MSMSTHSRSHVQVPGTKSLLDLVLRALPNDIKPSEILCWGQPEYWTLNPELALTYALNHSPRFNWRAYMENNPDVKQAGADPVLHFLKHGIYEGRKLISWNRLHDSMSIIPGAPKITVIVPSYNNDIYLEKCLNSALNQTLRDIEIIIVDDHSSDDSLAIADHFASLDSRVKVISLPQNMGTHMVRKQGVAAAKGDYIMFVDADDFLMLDACEKAYNLIVKGYDMVAFECNLIHHERGASNGNQGSCRTKWFGKLPNRAYNASEKVFLAFGEYKLPCFMGGKIYERSVAQKAFAEMGDFYAVFLEDMYAFLIINHYSRDLYKTDEVLFNYAIGSGISNRRCSQELALHPDKHLKILEHFRSFCETNDYLAIYDYFKNFIFAITLDGISYVETRDVETFFTSLARHFGILWSVKQFMRIFSGRIDQVSICMQNFTTDTRRRKLKRIGILHHNLSYGQTPRYISMLMYILLQVGYEVELFIEEEVPERCEVPAGVSIYYLADSRDFQRNGRKHLSDLYAACVRTGIDTLIYIPGRSPMLIWDALLLKLLGIQIITHIDTDINLDLVSRGQKYSQKQLHAALRCVDKVICSNTSSELYLRANGVNAIHLAPDIEPPAFIAQFEKRDDIILVFDALGDRLRRSAQALLCLGEVVKSVPGARMIFVGGAPNADFYKKAEEMDLRNNVSAVPYPANPQPLFEKAKAVFSGAFLEGWPLGLAAAQAAGIPAVIYDADIELAIDNDSIIRVRQEDHRTAAAEMVKLLTDRDLWQSLSRIAFHKVSRSPSGRYKKDWQDIVENCRAMSAFRNYSIDQWKRALRYMTFYAGKTVPQS